MPERLRPSWSSVEPSKLASATAVAARCECVVKKNENKISEGAPARAEANEMMVR